MNLKKALLAATVLALPVAAQAQPVSGLYVGAGAGANFLQETTDRGVKARFEAGYLGVVSVGWGFGNGLRAEVEGNFRSNDVDRVTARGVGRIGSSGYVYNYGAMANVLYDLPLGLPVSPYLGVGVGYGWTETRNVRLAAGAIRGTSNDTDGNLAYQGIAGLSYSLGAYVPGLYVTGEYRFYGTLEPELRVNSNIGSATYKPNNYNHSVLLGVRYAFNAPRPAPIVAPPPVTESPIARTYLVFFDWDRAELTDRARQIVAEAASAAPRVQSTRIEVAGHADRSGTPQYNQRLSQRRADAVAAELVRRGVARNAITVTAFGESRPLVATADGVREPQNRRVEIVLR